MKNHDIIFQNDDSGEPLRLGQTINVIAGRYLGKTGKAHRLFVPATNQQIELLVDDEHIFVHVDEIDFKFESAELVLFMNDDDREEFLELLKDYEDGYLSSL